jgi:hypothetical protein
MRRSIRSLTALTVLVLVASAGCSQSSSHEGSPSGCADDACAPIDGSASSSSGGDVGSGSSGSSGGAGGDASSDSTSGPASCSFDGKTVPSGSSVAAYQAASVSPGSVCVSQSRVCTDGTLSGTYAYGSCTVTLVPAFYVSPSGNDSAPGTLAQPFLTLQKAQSAMQGSASIKTTYLRAGTYALSASTATSNCDGGMGSTAIDLGSADSGETWSYYPPDGFGTAVLDGGSTSATTGVACAFAASGAS